MMRALQIGCVWPSEHGGGGDRVFADLARYLPAKGVGLEALFAGAASRRRADGRHPVQLRRGHRRHAGALAGRSHGRIAARAGLRASSTWSPRISRSTPRRRRLAPAGAARRALPRPVGRRVAPGRRRPAVGVREMERRARGLPHRPIASSCCRRPSPRWRRATTACPPGRSASSPAAPICSASR